MRGFRTMPQELQEYSRPLLEILEELHRENQDILVMGKSARIDQQTQLRGCVCFFLSGGGVRSPALQMACGCSGPIMGSELECRQWRMQRGEQRQRSKFPASAVSAAQKFKVPQQGHRPLRKGRGARCGGRWRLPGGGIGRRLIGAAQEIVCAGAVKIRQLQRVRRWGYLVCPFPVAR